MLAALLSHLFLAFLFLELCTFNKDIQILCKIFAKMSSNTHKKQYRKFYILHTINKSNAAIGFVYKLGVRYTTKRLSHQIKC